MIFGPDNKDVLIFPEKINGKYYALHRPTTKAREIRKCGLPNPITLYTGAITNIWRVCVMACGTAAVWAAVPFHSVRKKAGWSSTTVQPWITATAWGPLLDLNDPSKVIARSSQPIMEPEADYEKNGFFGDVVSPAAHWSMAMS